ncbi:hypothetical protein BJ973_003347 [Actinoplanes tereljensis]|nr:hypothetical protein [Actinoplanes tereljensis]
MDGREFHVDIATLDAAAAGIAETIDDQQRLALSRLPGPTGMYGDDDLHDAMAEFSKRWDDGLQILTEDAAAIGDSLVRVARAYRATDEATARRITYDPASGAVDG